MPGADPGRISDTLALLSGLDIETEIEVIAVPGIVDRECIKEIAGTMGKSTVLTIRNYDPRLANSPEAKKVPPTKRKDAEELRT